MADLVTFRVIVNSTTVVRSSGGGITGVIFIELGAQAFPERAWSDFPAVVLAWWLRELRDSLAAPGRPAMLLFMDGPFAIQLLPSSTDSWYVRLVSNDGMRVFGEGVAEGHEILAAVRHAALEVLELCVSRAWASDDIDALREAVAEGI